MASTKREEFRDHLFGETAGPREISSNEEEPMNDYIRSLRDDVRRLLDAGIESENDFVFVAIAGERLRRELHAAGAEQDAVVVAYDAFLGSRPARIPKHLSDDVTGALLELREYAEQPISQRDVEHGQALLDGLDELLCVITAARRAGAGSTCAGIDALVAEAVGAVAEITRPG